MIHGLPHLIVPPSRQRAGPTAYVHESPLAPEHIEWIDGIPVTSAARTAVDVARRSTAADAQMVIDAAARLLIARRGMDLRMAVLDERWRAVARTELQAVVAAQAGWPGIRRARAAVRDAEPAAESPAESVSRLRIAEWGLPRPECGVPVVGADGVTYWADVLWRDRRLIGECDGAIKYADAGVLVDEKRRQLALERAGFTIVRWMADEAFRGDMRFRRTLTAALD